MLNYEVKMNKNKIARELVKVAKSIMSVRTQFQRDVEDYILQSTDEDKLDMLAKFIKLRKKQLRSMGNRTR